MAKYFSPDGNIEVWESKPDGYYTNEEWESNHPELFPPGPYYEWDGSVWVLNQSDKDECNAISIRYERNNRALCALDSKSKYEREQISIINGITVNNPMNESEYLLVLQYIQDLFGLPEQVGFPWYGPNDPLCPWPTKPDCVCDTSII